MQTRLNHSESFYRALLLGACLLALMLATVSARAAPPTVYTVGNTASDPSCDYPQLRLALQAAAVQVGGYAEIRIAKSQDISLGYTWLGLNSAVTISDPQTEISIRGGYASCSATTATPGQYTRLTYYSNNNDAGHTMLAISNSTSNPRRYLDLVNIRMEGASDASKGGPSIGGGLKVTNNVEVTLRNSRISGFHAGAIGGGVALVGNSTVADPSQYPKLNLQDNSFVSNNSSHNLGGGIYADYGRVTLAGATVIGNTADNDGGGSTCTITRIPAVWVTTASTPWSCPERASQTSSAAMRPAQAHSPAPAARAAASTACMDRSCSSPIPAAPTFNPMSQATRPTWAGAYSSTAPPRTLAALSRRCF